MGYNLADYIKIKNEFENKYRLARQRAEERMNEVHVLIPEVFDIDKVLSHTGLDIMAVIGSGFKDTDAEIAKLEARNNELIARRERLLVSYGFAPDHTDVHYECERCGDTGYIDTHMCECMKRALAKAGYESSGLGRLIGKQTFDNFDLSYYAAEDGVRDRIQMYVGILKAFAKGFDGKSGESFLLLGTTGLGKTHLSTAVAQTVIDRGFDTLYVSAIGMISDFEANRFGSAGVSSSSNDVQRYYNADLLIIDDLGTEVVNKFTQSCVFEVINTRINMGKSTIINTNMGLTELTAVYTDRLSSRILGEYKPMLFQGKDIRKQKTTV